MAPSDSLASLLPPSHLGRYEVLERLGAGGMAEVLLCLRHGAGSFARAVAVKRILPFLAKAGGFRVMLRREAAIAATANHPNCVRIDELEENEGELLLSMELLYGLDASELSSRLASEGERIPPPVALRIGVDALRGLHHVHELRDADGNKLGVVHRDVSPHNIFVTESGLSKILDFGIATAIEAVDGDTMTGALKGKFRYMAPEQIHLRPLDARTDVWAVAVSIYELIAGRPLFPGAMMEVLDRLRAETIEISFGDVEGVSPTLERVLRRALAPSAAERFATAQELADALESECDVASPRVVSKLVESIARDRIAGLRRRVAKALRVEDRLADSGESEIEDASTSPALDGHVSAALDETALAQRDSPERSTGEHTAPAMPVARRESAGAKGGHARGRDTLRDETVSPLATRGARDTVMDDEMSPLAGASSPRRAVASPARTPRPRETEQASRVSWPTVSAMFVVGGALGWLLAELVF